MSQILAKEVGCSPPADPPLRSFACGDVTLQSGAVLPGAWLSYQTFGTLAADRHNAIVVPTHFGATHVNCHYLIGRGRALDPDKYFIVIPNLIGNGQSVSPSNVEGLDAADFPAVSMLDNVLLQRRLVQAELGVRQVQAVVGFSMGAAQAYHWAALCPDLVLRIAPICGSARTSEHNRAFLTGMSAALTSDSAWNEGSYEAQPSRGLRAMALAWSAWPPSAHFYRRRLYRQLGFHTLSDFLERYWVATYGGMDANNILAQIRTWLDADISRNQLFRGDFLQALKSISARVCIMPCSSDAYFPPEDSATEAAHLANATLRPIQSDWGHWAGSGRNPVDLSFIDQQLSDLLQSPA